MKMRSDMATEKAHYTAVIEVSRTVPETTETDSRGYNPKVKPRQVVEVARIIVRASSLDKLTEKAQAHLNLIEEDN